MTIKSKVCYGCKIEKTYDLFSIDITKKSGISSRCEECLARAKRERIYNNPDLYRNDFLIRKYGISLKDYNRILKSQKGLCKVCERPSTTISKITKGIRDLVVDHDHSHEELTGEIRIRGLLCHSCNTGLGLFLDDPKVLKRAFNYISK